jgi:pimeloyl-ACP methyl ester carboxylesterase
MPAVFVNGVPDTGAMWDPLLAHVERGDVVRLQPPGFGTPVPAGFGSTKEEYADWITAEIAALGEPADLVGHDWGCIHVQRVASTRPDLVRTLACGSGPVDREYEWHAMAQLWQTSDVADELMATMLTLPREDRVAGLVAGGSPPDLAELQVDPFDEAMVASILPLYRSATTVGAEWQDAVDAMPPRPSLVLWGRDDPYVAPEIGERLAARLGAELVMFDECAHWWPWERAPESAAALQRLWARAE